MVPIPSPGRASGFDLQRTYLGHRLLSMRTKPLENKKQQLKAFWVRKPNEELDKSGSWLLSHLRKLREEARTRADSV